jgi:hypothetical protein
VSQLWSGCATTALRDAYRWVEQHRDELNATLA